MYFVLTHFYGYVKNFLEFVVAYMTVMHYSPDAMEQYKQSICILFIFIRAFEVWQKNTLSLYLSNVINLRYLDKKRVFSIENNQYVTIEDTFFEK